VTCQQPGKAGIANKQQEPKQISQPADPSQTGLQRWPSFWPSLKRGRPRDSDQFEKIAGFQPAHWVLPAPLGAHCGGLWAWRAALILLLLIQQYYYCCI
jgi:hypothetical protein